MTLSIIILTCNQGAVTVRCLDSLDRFMCDNCGCQIIIVDNGSIESVEAVINRQKYVWRDRLKVLTMPENLGVAGGRNVGLKAVGNKGGYVMLLDNDTIVPQGAIEYMVGFMDCHKDIGLLAPKLVSPDGLWQASFKKFPGIKEKLLNLMGRSPYIKNPPSHLIDPFYVIGACQLIRASVLLKTGLLDDKIFFGPEDADFCMRVRANGYRVVYQPSVSIVHDWQRASSKSLFSKTSRRHIKGLFYFYGKWGRWWY